MAIVKNHKSNVLLNPKYFKDEQVLDGAQVIGAVDASVEGAAHNDRMNRFRGKQGHGVAAEQANDVIDKLYGKKTAILGDDNAKNGPDRLIDGRWVQTKYYKDAKSSVNAAFKNGKYCYLDSDGRPMQLEVPKRL